MTTFKGTTDNDELVGSKDNDELLGFDGDDAINGGLGDDYIDGGAGNDTAVYSGPIADYRIEYDGKKGKLTVFDSVVNRDGIDTVIEVEIFSFNKTLITLDEMIKLVTAAPVNQTLTGTSAADSFTSGPGNDTIDGGGDIDTAIFNGNLAKYTLTKSGGTYTVRDNSGTDGTDTLTNVESLKFTDLTVNLQIQAIAAAAPLADVQRISELYVAFFNRTPDADGLAYWIGQKMAGQSINQISEAFYSVGASSTYSSLTGFSTSMTNTDFLNVFYKNVLGRPEGADAGGLAYWNAKLADGRSTRSSLANDILDSAHTFKGNPTWGWVADLLDNKIAVANTIAVEWGLTYNTDAYARGVAIAEAITPTDTAAAIALIGVTGSDLNLG